MRVFLVAPEGLPIPVDRGGSVQIYLEKLFVNVKQSADLQVSLISPGRTKIHESLHSPIDERDQTQYRAGVQKLIEQLSPDVVQIDNRPDFAMKLRQLLYAKRIVLNLHSTTFLQERHIAYPIARQILRQADAVVCNSQYLQATVARQFQLTASDWHPYVIYPGVDANVFARPVEHGRSYAKSTLHILCAGRIIPQKGVLVLVQAVRQLLRMGVQTELTIVGRSPAWAKAYEKKIQQEMRDLPVHWTRGVQPQEMPAYYWQADLFVFPSQWDEAFGLVNLEAFAAGVPVVASALGGIPEVVTPDCGVLVYQYSKPLAFAQAIADLWAQPDLFYDLRIGAKARALEFSWTGCAQRFETLYLRLG